METDEVTEGQWFKGRIYERRCDLSPDGRLFVYFAADHDYRSGASWTAISRPPFLTALALWFKGDAWDGGGVFDGNHHVKINDLGGHRFAEKFELPKLEVSSLGEMRGEDWPIEQDRRLRDGWKVVHDFEASRRPNWQGYTTHKPRVMVKVVGEITIEENYSINGYNCVRTFVGKIGGKAIDLAGASHADIDPARNRVVYTLKGKLIVADGKSVREICDLSENRFRPIPPEEWAKQWP